VLKFASRPIAKKVNIQRRIGVLARYVSASCAVSMTTRNAISETAASVSARSFHDGRSLFFLLLVEIFAAITHNQLAHAKREDAVHSGGERHHHADQTKPRRPKQAGAIIPCTTLNPRLMVLLLNNAPLERITLAKSGSFLNFEKRDMGEIINALKAIKKDLRGFENSEV
jgi:hypothetical protein